MTTKTLVAIFFGVMLLTGCPDSERVSERLLDPQTYYSDDRDVGAPDQDAGKEDAEQAPDATIPVSPGFTVETSATYASLASDSTILMALTNSPEKPDWSKEMTMKSNADKEGNVSRKAGFGRLGDGTYAVSLPSPATENWYLHISAGEEINGVFREGYLLNANGTPSPITSAVYSFVFSSGEEKKGVKASSTSGSYGRIEFPATQNYYSNMIYDGYSLNLKIELRFLGNPPNGYSSTKQYPFELKYSNIPVDEKGLLYTSG